MELEAAKMIGAGLAAMLLAGAGVRIGTIFVGNYLAAAIRNPPAAQKQFPNLLLGFALAEATGLFWTCYRTDYFICIFRKMKYLVMFLMSASACQCKRKRVCHSLMLLVGDLKFSGCFKLFTILYIVV